MSTDIYGVRVLDVDTAANRVRLRVFIVHYDIANRSHAPVPDDPSLFFQLLWEAAGDQHFRTDTWLPLYDLTPLKDSYDFDWIDAHTRQFVERVVPLGTRNHPVRDWDRLHDYYPIRDDSWADEELLAQFDFDVYVTDPRWLAHLRDGQSWASVAWPIHADTWRDDEADRLPQLRHPVLTAAPFPHDTFDFPAGLVFSDDSRYLAMASAEGQVAVYDTRSWRRRTRQPSGQWNVSSLMWVPGAHVLVVKDHNDETEPPQWSYNVDSGRLVTVPRQLGRARSADGAVRVGSYSYGTLDFLTDGGTSRRIRVGAGDGEPVQSHVFSADGGTLFVGTQDKVYIMDPGTGAVRGVLPHPEGRVFGIASSPDGRYLAMTGISRKRRYMPWNGHEVTVWRTSDGELILGRHLDVYVDDVAWSPDGRWLAASTVPVGDSEHNLGLKVFAVGVSHQLATVTDLAA